MPKSRVLTVFESVFENIDPAATASLIYNEFPGWDSLGHMKLVAALEAEFDCMLEMDEILGMNCFDVAVETMKKHAT